jgi:hypothetical protein
MLELAVAPVGALGVAVAAGVSARPQAVSRVEPADRIHTYLRNVLRLMGCPSSDPEWPIRLDDFL